MQAFVVSNLRLISGFDQRFERRLYQRANTAAKDGLFAEQVALGFFFEGRFDYARLQIARRPGICERILFRLAADVLMDRKKSGYADAFNEQLTHAMARRLRCNHADVRSEEHTSELQSRPHLV